MRLFSVVILFACVSSCVDDVDAAERPNVLFLFADDQQADTIGAWGNPHLRTLNLDRLVARGFSFRNNYCFGSNSGAVCVPSRAMLMSGRTWLDVKHDLAGATLLPEALRGGGYQTFATGKWHNGQPSCLRAFPNAKSIFFGGMTDHTDLKVADVQNGRVINQRAAEKFSSEQFADAVVDFLEHQQETDPFFCYARPSPRRTIRETHQRISGRCTTRSDRRSRRISCHSIRSTTASPKTFVTRIWQGIRAAKRRSAISSASTTAWSPTSTNRSAECLPRSKSPAKPKTRSSFTRPIMDSRWGATGCSASGACTSTA